MKTFLDLPPEIRNRIYFFIESLVVPQPKPGSGLEELDGGINVYQGKIFAWYSPTETGIDYPPVHFPRQPNITKICRQMREETLPIFYGVNRFVVMDLYEYQSDGLQPTFPTILWEALNNVKSHISLMKHVEIQCRMSSAQMAHEIIAALTDHGFDFKVGVLKERVSEMV